MITALIVAAGKGLRMQSEVPKQYLLLAAEPILSRTLRVFDQCEAIDAICLVVAESDLAFCRQEILPSAGLGKAITLVAGGVERHHSVYNGLQAMEAGTEIVVIHDGVRPFIDPAQIRASIDGARRFGACILAIPARDTLKRADSSNLIIDTLDRETVWLAQTPQAFQYSLIRQAHESASRAGYRSTDDAVLVERMGKPVKIIEGSPLNIKITSPEDFKLASAILALPGWSLQRVNHSQHRDNSQDTSRRGGPKS
jgi:2-C-methyl-D-erythritol 4-phosphate cytidylyltransferase